MTESPLVQRELVIGDSLTKQARPRTFSGRQRADRCNGRFLDRSAPNGQSDGMLNIERSNKPGGSGLYYKVFLLMVYSTVELGPAPRASSL
jgi:hypothetical protein